MADPHFGDFDHDSHMRKAFELAREAADRGDRPFGSVLVRDDTVVMADSNRVLTENDIRRHPELHLAYRAGFASGYGGEGMKTIIPSTAKLKMDMRLVADQDPDDIYDKFRSYVENHTSETVDVGVSKLGTMSPQRTPLDHPIREPILDAVAEGWDTDPILKPTLGGSLPTAAFARHLETPVVVVPYANSDENNHSPDENLTLDCFENGVRTTAALLDRLVNYEE